MSAFIVDYNHINYLMNAALSRRIAWHGFYFKGLKVDKNRAQEIGQMLWDENRRSVDYRYQENNGDEEYEYKPIFHHVFDPVQVLKAIKCLDYQSCEHEEWESSGAKEFLDTLMHFAISALPGYEDAQWGAPKNIK